MNRTVFILVFGLTLLIQSCESLFFSGEGEWISDAESFQSFSQISIYDIFDVELYSDSIYSLEIETYEKYYENIEVAIDSGILSLKDKNKGKWMPDYPMPKVRIGFPRLDRHILIEAPVRLKTIDTLSIPYLKIQSLGKSGEFDLLLNVDNFNITTGSDNAGLYTIKGEATNARFWPRGSSVVDASKLKTSSCFVYNNSIGDCEVSVEDMLEVRLNTLGNILYYGDPSEIKILEESGDGRLIKATK